MRAQKRQRAERDVQEAVGARISLAAMLPLGMLLTATTLLRHVYAVGRELNTRSGSIEFLAVHRGNWFTGERTVLLVEK